MDKNTGQKIMNKALFLDRDGVVNVDKGFVHKTEDFQFADGIFSFCRYFSGAGYRVFIVTNQSGIARGYFTEEDFSRLNAWMLDEFEKNGVFITEVRYCPYHPEGVIERYKRESTDRKPNAGMILKIARKYGLDLNNSVLIGDRREDMAAAQAAGIGHYFALRGAYELPPETTAFDSLDSLLAYWRKYQDKGVMRL
ncbi:MAG: HAD family hydrolase [Syntrophomonadaceae bacterium]|jgi:D-glycero-D-manno-heptose 1,7-bisphosphate phosphatase|nr:HAD family hydrolase [Syntrophomonadaceae bacterium]